jgi:hypothetical protein
MQFHTLALNFIDTHSTAYYSYSYPATWLGRESINLGALAKSK